MLEPTRIDGSTPGVSSMEDILQFVLKPSRSAQFQSSPGRDGHVPVLEWLDTLPAKIQDKCVVKIERLRELGHELRRPEADLLRDGIDELRIGWEGMSYRILYFFHGRMAAVLAHGLIKEREVPAKDIQSALVRKRLFEQDPHGHIYREE